MPVERSKVERDDQQVAAHHQRIQIKDRDKYTYKNTKIQNTQL